MPRSLVIQRIGYRAARAGLLTGVLLAVARVSGETAPLLFTALNNQFWSLDLNAPMSSLPAVIFQFALSPYKEWQQLAWTGALDHHVGRLGAQHRRARARRKRKLEMTVVADISHGGAEKVSVRNLQVLLWRIARAEERHAAALRTQGHRLHRAFRLRQVDPVAGSQPHVRPLSQPARRG